MNIVMLQGKDLTEKIFTRQHLESLQRLSHLRINPLPGPPSPAQVEELVGDADIVVTSWGCPSMSARILDLAPRLQFIFHAAGTVKPIVTSEMLARDIRISSANEALAIGVAETTLGLIISSLKNMWTLASDTRAGGWDTNNPNIRELYGLTIGIIGAGYSGSHLIRLLRQFDVKVIVCDPYQSEEQIAALGCEKVVLEQLLRQSDVVSIHAASVRETERLINERALQLMKDDAILINTARGSIIDEDALANELGKGRLWACIDVTKPEPPALDHPFRKLPNVTLIPHIAGATNNGLYRIGAYAVKELELFLQGHSLERAVDLSRLHHLA